MIPSAIIDQYLNRSLDDHRWIKQLNRGELLDAIDQLDPVPRLNPLRLHQYACFLLGVAYPAFGYWLDMGCVDGDTEYLSPEGWVKIRNYPGGLVAQYEPTTREASFIKPVRYIDRPCETMLHFKSARGCDQMVSPEHSLLVISGRVDPTHVKSTNASAWKTETHVTALPEYASPGWGATPCFYRLRADQAADQTGLRFETTFNMDGPGLPLTDEQLRVQVAVHADGYLCNKTKVDINIKKPRKHARLKSLLAAAKIPYKIYDKRAPGYLNFRFVPPLHSKVYGPEWYRASLEQKRVICDEVSHWDGSRDKAGATNFFSRSKPCADFIQFCFASTRRRAFVGSVRDSDGKLDYTVHAIGTGRTTNLAHLGGSTVVAAPGGRKFCFETPSGYLVLRRNGNIFVTGNSGKTLLSLELLRYWWDCGRLRRGLILVTSDKAYLTWRRQIERFKIDLPYVFLDGSSAEKWSQLDRFGDGLVVVHYPGMVAMMTQAVKDGRKTKWQIDPDALAHFADRIDGLVMDESTKLGNPNSLTHKIGQHLADRAFARYALAGRPFGRDPMLLYPQFDLIDRGETLGETLGLFREAFFNSSKNYAARGRGRAAARRAKHVREYKFNKRMMPTLTKIIQNRSITYATRELPDLPPLERTPVTEVVRLPEEAAAYYQRVVDQIIAAKGNVTQMQSAFVRMRQLSSGFLALWGEDDERVEVKFDDNPKLDLLFELTEEVPEDSKAVIFYDFTFSGRAILEHLDNEAIWLWSGTKQPTMALERFLTDPTCRYAVINNKVGAYSLDGLQEVANYVFFYESPVSAIDREQSERRVLRQGQPKHVFQYDLVVENTADEKILEFHAEGRSLYQELTKAPELFFVRGRRRA